MMGCKWCTSGLGRKCAGPHGIDDLEVGCECACHVCVLCENTNCVNIGGDEECDRGRDDDEWSSHSEDDWSDDETA